jgi:NAD(P)-dependent dehydrogenase (short-subunit alcohol dehydrogenase family)
MHPIEQLTEQERSMGKLEGKIALVTGGNSGIGLAAAKRFVTEGAYVFITGRREPELAAAVKEIGRNVTGIRGDVSNLGDLDRLFAQIEREKGKDGGLDELVELSWRRAWRSRTVASNSAIRSSITFQAVRRAA